MDAPKEQLAAPPSKGIQEGAFALALGEGRSGQARLWVWGSLSTHSRGREAPRWSLCLEAPAQQQRQGESGLAPTWHWLEPNEEGPAVAHPRHHRPNRPGPCTAAREPSGLAAGEAGRSAWLGNRGLAAGTARSRMPQLLRRAKARVREGQ